MPSVRRTSRTSRSTWGLRSRRADQPSTFPLTAAGDRPLSTSPLVLRRFNSFIAFGSVKRNAAPHIFRFIRRFRLPADGASCVTGVLTGLGEGDRLRHPEELQPLADL